MSRKAAREAAVQIIYEYGFNHDSITDLLNFRLSEAFNDMIKDDTESFEQIDVKQHGYLKNVVLNSVEKQEEFEGRIEKYSIGWNLNRISRIARAIMQVALYEIKYVEDVPESVAINEAVEIAKKYDSPETVSFINGILGSIVREETRC